MLTVARDRRGGRRSGRIREHPPDEPRARGPDRRRRALRACSRSPGRPAVGWPMKARAGKKRVVLELGGNAGAIVDRTRRPRLGRPADHRRRLQLLAARSASASSASSSTTTSSTSSSTGSSPAPRALRLGDPLDPETDLGPMVDAKAAARTQAWVDEAVGGRRARPARRPRRGHVLPADDPGGRAARRRRCARRRRSPRSSCSPASRTSRTRSPRRTTPGSGSRRASSRTTSATHSGPSTAWRSAASSSTTSRPTGSTTCPTAG